MILNLDKAFKPYPGKQEIAFDAFTFSGGEPHIKIHTELSGSGEVTVSQRLQTFNDLGFLLVAIDALRNLGVNTIHLVIPYFPAARQDRLMVKGEALTVKVYADIINSLSLNSVLVFDPHSEVTPALLNNCQVIENYSFIKEVMKQIDESAYLISPDGGALKKIYKLAAVLESYDVVECSKSRDVRTGKLSGFKVYADDLAGRDCLVVDDICDGGGTFLGLAKELKAKNAGKLYLAVSHGIFSKGLDELSKSFDHIFTTDAYCTLGPNEGLHQIQLSKIL